VAMAGHNASPMSLVNHGSEVSGGYDRTPNKGLATTPNGEYTRSVFSFLLGTSGFTYVLPRIPR